MRESQPITIDTCITHTATALAYGKDRIEVEITTPGSTGADDVVGVRFIINDAGGHITEAAFDLYAVDLEALPRALDAAIATARNARILAAA